MRPVRWLLVAVGFALLVPGVSRADAGYRVQVIVNGSDLAGELVDPAAPGSFELAGLNDDGHIGFYALRNGDLIALLESGAGAPTPILKGGAKVGNLQINSVGKGASGPSTNGYTTLTGVDDNKHAVLLQNGPGGLSVIAAVGGEAPGGRWDQLNLPIDGAVSMNQAGNVVFSGDVTGGNPMSSGTFLWDSGSKQLQLVTAKQVRGGDLKLILSLPTIVPAINSQNEIAFGALVKKADGTGAAGLVLLDRNGQLQPVAFEGQKLPNGDQIGIVSDPVLSDAGVVAFRATRQSDHREALYRWQNGTVTSTGVVQGADAPGGGQFARIEKAWLNSKNGNIVVAARVYGFDSPAGLYLFADGQLRALAAPGQTMPDGSISAGYSAHPQVSSSNDAGQIAFSTELKDGTAAYMLGPDGAVSLILKSGTTTSVGTITNIGGFGRYSNLVGLNNRGQVALPAFVITPSASSVAILLFTPVTP